MRKLKLYLDTSVWNFFFADDAPGTKRDQLGELIKTCPVAEMDALVTWNFQHLANLRKAELFHSVSLEMGYLKKLEIVTPMEVSRYED